MKLPLAYYNDPVLRKKTAPITEITDELRQLAMDMFETMREHDGIGLAAPQVNLSISLFVMEVPIEVPQEGQHSLWLPGQPRVCINPKILSYTQEKWWRGEGCLSIPGVYGEVERPIGIIGEATDLDGNRVQLELSWLEARCFMHENDHVNGVLFFDRIHGKKEKEMIEKALSEFKKHFNKS